jgi:RNA polymerase sigma-70 factor (ECF subfamily)
MDRDEERMLVERARSGSLVPFDVLMRAQQDGLYRFVRVRGASEADAEDIVQETFIAAWRYLGSYRSRWRFSTWLYTIARREASRRPRDHEALPAELIAAGAGPAGRAEAGEQRDNLWRVARGSLPAPWFDALWLFYGEERSVAETARVLERSLPWVKVTLHRARKRLAEAIDGRDGPGKEAFE